MKTNIPRRKFLTASMTAAIAALAACAPKYTQTPEAAATGAFTSTPAATRMPSFTQTPVPTGTMPAAEDALLISRALRRILFAPTPDDLARAAQIGLDAFIEEQLAPQSIPDADVAARLSAYTTLNMAPGDLAKIPSRQQPAKELIQATLVRAVYSRRQLYELMVDFWSNHFNIYIGKNADYFLKTVDDREVIRPHALGKFSDILSASAHSPAMLVFLDNALSNKKNPNENYGRELMELHTISVEGGYTQADVSAAARALTGWTSYGAKAAKAGTYYYNPKLHDDGEKTILGVNFPAGQGVKDGEQLLALLAGRPSTATFLATKLARRFVSDNPPADLVAQAADTFTRTGGDITKVMSVILHSQAFQASLKQKIKRPFEYMVSALRVTGADLHPDTSTVSTLRMFGQAPFSWESPNGYPDGAGAWVTTSGLLRRWNYALGLTANGLRDARVDFANLIGPQSSVSDGIDALSMRLLGEPLCEAERQVLIDYAGKDDFEMVQPALAALILCTTDFQYR